MLLKYDVDFSQSVIKNNIKRIINQVYKLLPMRQERNDWIKPLQTIIEQLIGMKRLCLEFEQDNFFMLLCKLEGLLVLTQEKDFSLYRRTIFECLSLLGEIRNNV